MTRKDHKLPTTPASDVATETLEALQWYYPARLIEVVDADTVEVEIDMGFHCFHRERVRVAGVDAWEMTGDERRQGERAKAAALGWFIRARHEADVASQNFELTVRTYYVASRRGLRQDSSLGRWIGDIWSATSGESYAAWLVANGFARGSDAG